MKPEEIQQWTKLTRMYPELAGMAYELYMRHPKKDAKPMTYFKFAEKRINQRDKRYNQGLEKYKRIERYKMECKND